ncbi:alpha/beta hydrolase [Actinospica sp.]|uniref:alpha/beta hydrolase n=1 Tax=Actinospica sp. TaxID=1872142 RepID=UPI002BC7334D|nr:alpha/beta hydrolase [Actinospica sp.]HWG28069.1 alpha/beta hydrolase [Actinospica sp.]
MELAAPVRALLERYQSMAGGGLNLDDPDVLAMIRTIAIQKDLDLSDGPVDGVEISDVVIDEVPVRLYRPPAGGGLPLHVYFHGGGFILGSALTGELDGLLSRRALDAGCLVASVEYRLAPEHRFPAGVNDCYAAFTGLLADAERYGIAREVVTVGGGSAGGNLAAVVALMARDVSGPRIALQLIEIAGLDLTDSSRAWRNPGLGHDSTREADVAWNDRHISSPAERVHPYVSPFFAPNLEGVAPAFVINAEFDPRRDECEAYVARLRDAGVHAVSRTMAGHIHGSSVLPDWQPARDWRAEANAVLASAHQAALAGRPVELPAAA